MDERKLDEVIADVEDVKTLIDDVRFVHPEGADELLEHAHDALSDVIHVLENDQASDA